MTTTRRKGNYNHVCGTCSKQCCDSYHLKLHRFRSHVLPVDWPHHCTSPGCEDPHFVTLAELERHKLCQHERARIVGDETVDPEASDVKGMRHEITEAKVCDLIKQAEDLRRCIGDQAPGTSFSLGGCDNHDLV